jgi:hypothetical protein
MIGAITMFKHHHGYMVQWPATWEDWDWRTYREKYFETSGRGSESGYRKAQRHKRELISELKEFEKSIAVKSMTANERKQKQRDAMREKGLVKKEVWIKKKHIESLNMFVKSLN